MAESHVADGNLSSCRAIFLVWGAKIDLVNPISLTDMFPERPYFAAPSFLRGLAAYNAALNHVFSASLKKYDALLMVGGSGPIVDLANNQRVHDLILSFYRSGNWIRCRMLRRHLASFSF